MVHAVVRVQAVVEFPIIRFTVVTRNTYIFPDSVTLSLCFCDNSNSLNGWFIQREQARRNWRKYTSPHRLDPAKKKKKETKKKKTKKNQKKKKKLT